MLAGLLPAAAEPPARFAVEDVLTGIEQPMGLRFLPDGRMLVIQKKGLVRIVDLSTTPASSATYLNLESGAHPHGIEADQERGLIDIAIDPGFPAQPYIYLFYTPRTGPNGPRARVARFTHRQNSGGLSSRADPASEVILWQDTNGYDSCCHYGGGLDFGPDGKLWLTLGDHFQGSYAASLEHAGGGVVRINKNGSVPADNPYVDGSGPNHDPLFAHGLRNPFRARWDLPSGRFYIAEVGGNEQSKAWEDLHVIEYDAATGRFIDGDFGTASDNGRFDGINFGWPTVEGLPPHPDFPGAEIDPVGEPIFGYRHAGETAAINGGVVYRHTLFPSHLRGAYFYSDSTRDFIRYLKFEDDGTLVPNPNPAPISLKNPDQVSYPFDLQPHGRIVALEVGPDGALYVVSFTDQGGAYGVPNPTALGAVRRYVYDAGNARPDIDQFSANPADGQPPLAVSFTLRATDLERDPMRYVVHFGDGTTSGDPQPLLHDTDTVITHSYTSRGVFDVEVEVTDGTTTTVRKLAVKVGSPPQITALTSRNSRAGASSTSFRYGDTFTFSATATDAEDGTLTGAAFTWTIWFVRPGNVHPALPAETGVTSVNFGIPAQGQGFSGPVFYRVALTVTDSDGLTTDATFDVYPEKSDIAFDTVPAGIVVQVDGNTSKPAPFVLDTLINFPHTITVPETVCLEGNQYRFARWSNGVTTPQQTYTVPVNDSALTATYTLVGACVGPPETGLVMHLNADRGVVLDGGAVGVWEDQSASGNHLLASGAPDLVERSGTTPGYVHFDGQDDALGRTGFIGLPSGDAPRSVFMVARYNAANSSTGGWAGFAYGSRSTNAVFGLALTPSGTLGVQGWGAGNDLPASPAEVVTGRWVSHGAIYNGSSITQYVNGAAAGTASHRYATGTGSIRLGEELGGGKNLDMDVAEILVYDRVLTADEREQIHAYLQQTYNLGPGGGSNAPPTVSITAPADDAQLSTAAMPVTLTGTASDPEDGSISSRLAWRSSLDGALGSGASVTATLSAGTHTLTATATDAGGLQASDSITVVVSGSGGTGGLVTAGLVVHLEADLNVSTGTGSTVAGWLDQSGLGNDLIAGGAPQLVSAGTPTGRPAIRFDGTDDLLQRRHVEDPLGGLPTANANRTMVVVAKYNRTSAWGGVSYGAASANRAFGLGVKHSSGEPFLQGYGGGNDLVSTATGTGAGWLVQTGVLNNGTATLFKDGAQVAQFSHAYATTLDRLVIAQELGSRGFIGMDVAAVLVYDRALSAAERSSVEAYLANKYVGTGGGSNTAPTVAITAPADGATVTAGSSVTLRGTASDPEDGDLSSALAWSSSLDGALGSGASVTTSSLRSGTHTITARVTDRAAASATATITLTVSGASAGGPPVTGGLVLRFESDTGVVNGSGGVSRWEDASGKQNHLLGSGGVTLAASGTPTGRPALRLDGVNDVLQRTHATNPLTGLPIGNANRTMFVVASYHRTTAWGGASYGTASANRAFGLGVKHSSGELYLHGYGAGHDLVSTTPGVGAGWLVQTGLLNNGTATLFKDGTQIARFDHTYATSLTRLAVGQELGNRGYIGLEVAAILLYDRALTATERGEVEAYLRQKYVGGGGGNAAPTVAIAAPATNTSYPSGTNVTFTGTASDPEDGDLTAAMTWSSSLDGLIGTGGTVSTSSLSVGTHTVTARAADGESQAGSASITVTITTGSAGQTLPVTSGLVLRLESSTGVTTSGSAVTRWADASPSGNDLTGSGGPILVSAGTPTGQPAIRLDGLNDRLERVHSSQPLNSLPTGNANRSVFLVAKYHRADRAGGLAYGAAASNQTFGLAARPAGELLLQGYGAGNDLVSATAGVGAGWLVQTGVLNNGTATLFRDTTKIAQTAHTYATSLSRLVIGQEIGGAGYVNLEVAAALIYNRALTATERDQVIAYLRTRYIQ